MSEMTSSASCWPCKKTMEVKHNLIRYFDMFADIGGFRTMDDELRKENGIWSG